MRIDDPGVSDLQFVGVAKAAGCLVLQVERSDAVALRCASIERIADGDEVVLAELEINAGVYDEKACGSGDGLVDVGGERGRVQRVDDVLILARDREAVEEKRGSFGDRAGDIA